jgi:hypothetical protein
VAVRRPGDASDPVRRAARGLPAATAAELARRARREVEAALREALAGAVRDG